MDLLDLVIKITADDSEAEKKVNDSGNKLSSILGTAAKVGVAAVGAAVGAVGTFGVSAIKAGSDFDVAMSQVAATSGKSVAEIQNLRDFAQEMGSTTAFSATQAAEALNFMALAGYDAEKSMDVMPTVLNLAAAGGIDLASASDMVTDAMAALGLGVTDTKGDAEMFADSLAKTSSITNTSVAQLGEAILTIGATAQSMTGHLVDLGGGEYAVTSSTSELNAALGIMANVGIKGAEGGTHLRNILLSLQSPTDKSAAALRELGISVYDSNGEMRNLNDIMVDFNESMSGMEQAAKDQYLSEIFNKTDLASVSALLDNAGESWQNLAWNIEKSSDSASKMAETQLDNLAGSVTLFKSALEGLQIAVSDALAPSLNEFVKFGSESLSALTKGFQEGGVEGAMAALEDIVENLITMLGETLPKFLKIGIDVLGAFGNGLMKALPKLLDAATKLLLDFSNKLLEEAPKVIPPAIETMAKFIGTILEHLPQIIEAAVNIIAALVLGLLAEIFKLADPAFQAVAKIVESIRAKLNDIIETGKALINSFIEGIKAKFNELVESGRNIIEQVKNGLMGMIGQAKTWGQDLISNFIGGIKAKFSELKDTIVDIADTVADFIGFSEPEKGPLSRFHTFAPDMMELFAQGITENKRLITDAIEDSFDLAPVIAGSTGQNNSVSVTQNIYSKAQTASELMREARWEQERAVLMGV